jgi:hypothetical protein
LLDRAKNYRGNPAQLPIDYKALDEKAKQGKECWETVTLEGVLDEKTVSSNFSMIIFKLNSYFSLGNFFILVPSLIPIVILDSS